MGLLRQGAWRYGEVKKIALTTGSATWTDAIGDGPVKGPVWTDLSTGLFVSTSTKVTKLADGGASASESWNVPLDSPSPLLVILGRLYVGTGGGTPALVELSNLNAGTPAQKSVTLGAGNAAIGAASLDLSNSTVVVGDENGSIHGVSYPLP